MDVGLYLQGRCELAATDPGGWAGQLVSWFDENAGEPLLEPARLVRDGQGHPVVTAGLHPCAEELEVRVTGTGRVVASGKTSGAGPGYHVYVCELLRRIGDDLGVTWQPPDPATGEEDAGGYFASRDISALEDEFLGWLRQIARLVLDRLGEDYKSLMISMPIGHTYTHISTLATPMGPRGREWLEAVADDPRRGVDVFPWWAPGIDAPFFLGRALARMWRDVRWRVPLNEAEGQLLMETHLDLARACSLDPSLAYPWREWAELMDFIQEYFGYLEMHGDDVEDDVRAHAAAMFRTATPPLVGYRRHPVRVILTDGWSIEIPGELAEDWDDEGLWFAQDDTRAVHFKSFELNKSDGEKPTAAEILEGLTLPDGDPVEPGESPIPGRAVVYASEGEGELGWRLTGHAAVDGGLSICHVIFRDPDDRDWAIAAWRSLEHP